VNHVLVGSVVDQDVDPAELANGFVYNLLAVLLRLDIRRVQTAGLSVLFYATLGLLGVLLFLWQVVDENVGTFETEEDGNGTSDSRISASDEGFLSLELASRLVLLVATILGWEVGVLRVWALHLRLESRLALVRDWDLMALRASSVSAQSSEGALPTGLELRVLSRGRLCDILCGLHCDIEVVLEGEDVYQANRWVDGSVEKKKSVTGRYTYPLYIHKQHDYFNC
jgi:hypothetical protein